MLVLTGAVAATVLLGGLATPLQAQDDTATRIADAVSSLEWREVGPTIMGGRVSDLAVVESDVSTFYVGTATAGVWKTVNGGIGFEQVFRDEETASVGDVTVAPSNPNVVWVGTGEPQNRQSSPWGHGVYRSVDAGRTWSHLGLEETRHIGRIRVHPTDPDVAYVAAVGHLWGPNEERGVYRTTDGGESWEKVLYVDENTGAIDLVMDPGDPRTLFAAMYQRRRRAWGFNGGGPGSGIYRTTDGGDTWEELTEGLPEGDMGRIGLSIYRGDGNIVYALVEADARGAGFGFGGGSRGDRENGVYRSTDRGETWEHLSTTNNRPMYYSQIRIDPNDPERIYLGGSRLYRSSDGGRNFTPDAARGVHLDHHAIWIDPHDSDHLLLGSDGGVSVSRDRAESWYQFRNLPIAQFYEVSAGAEDPYHVCGGLQDNGSWCAPSDTWSNQGIRTRDWYNVGSGDGFVTIQHPTDPDVVFAESQGGNLTRVDLATMERTRLRPYERPRADEDEELDLRWNWDTPVLLSSHDPETVYIGANVLFRSRDLGQSWERISPDLTWAVDRDTLELMGVAGSEPQMSRNDGQSSYGNLTALAESPLDPDVLYTGADDGRLHVTRDGGATWTDVTANVPELPAYTYVTRLVASHADPGTVFAAFDGHRSDDYAPYVYVSRDFGESWELRVEGLPHTSVNALAQHPRDPALLFVGNEVGVYASVDAGGSWFEIGSNMPTVPVDDIVVQERENDLVLGTHGRGIWILDDIAPLEHMSAEVLASRAHVFPARRATSYNAYRPQGWTPGIWEAPNPPAGARIRYHLAEEGDSVDLTIADGSGRTVRELKGSGEAGLNEVVWDLRLVEDDARGEPMDPGPRVLPGTYTVSLSVPQEEMAGEGSEGMEEDGMGGSGGDGAEEDGMDESEMVRTTGNGALETTVDVRLDPRVEIARADLLARQEAMLDSYRLSGPAEQADDALERLAERLEEIENVLAGAADTPEALTDEVEAFASAVDSLEDDLGEADDGANMWFVIQLATHPPTEDQLWQIERSWEELPGVIERVNALVSERMPALVGRVYTEEARPEAGETVAMPRRGG